MNLFKIVDLNEGKNILFFFSGYIYLEKQRLFQTDFFTANNQKEWDLFLPILYDFNLKVVPNLLQFRPVALQTSSTTFVLRLLFLILLA